MEQQNKNSKNTCVHSMQATPLCLDQSYIQGFDHADAVLCYRRWQGFTSKLGFIISYEVSPQAFRTTE